MARMGTVDFGARAVRQIARTVVVGVAVVAALVFATGTNTVRGASSSTVRGLLSEARTTSYTVSLSNWSFVGPPVLLVPSECKAQLLGGAAISESVKITVAGGSIKVATKGLTFTGSFDRVTRTFITKAELPPPGVGVTEIAAFDGKIAPSGVIKGGYSVTALSPQSSCIYRATGEPLS